MVIGELTGDVTGKVEITRFQGRPVDMMTD